MPPIRVGFIGLSVSPASWANEAHVHHLLSSPDYKVVALANSSVKSSQEAIKHYSLPASTKAYGSAAELASDPDVDLVVCSVKVAQHYPLIKPALEHGKMVFVEWPLGCNLQEAEELAHLAGQKGVRTMIGLQGRKSLFIATIKRLVDEGRVGRVLSSTVMAEIGSIFGPQIPLNYRYFTDRSVGGNIVTVHLIHAMDSISRVLGEFATFTSVLGNQIPFVDIVDNNGKVVEAGVKKDTYDHIMLQGTFVSGAVMSLQLRGGKGFKGSPGLVWRIYGEKGEIMITTSGPTLQIGPDDLVIKIYDNDTDSVEEIELPKDPKAELPVPGRNVARLYDAFANGDQFPTFNDAVARHRFIDLVYQSSEEGRKVQYEA